MKRRGYRPKLGERFGRWTIVAEASNQRRQLRSLCLCDCGAQRSVENRFLKNGQSTSCGCARADAFVERNVQHGLSKVHPVEFRAWDAMNYRCHDAKCRSYKNYGARGIAVCDRWRYGEGGRYGFECFLADMGERPSPQHSIDRIDVDGNYEPSNVRWADKKQQARNRRNTKRYKFRGRLLSPTEISDLTGIPSNTFAMRVENYGWPIEKAATLPVGASFRRAELC